MFAFLVFFLFFSGLYFVEKYEKKNKFLLTSLHKINNSEPKLENSKSLNSNTLDKFDPNDSDSNTIDKSDSNSVNESETNIVDKSDSNSANESETNIVNASESIDSNPNDNSDTVDSNSEDNADDKIAEIISDMISPQLVNIDNNNNILNNEKEIDKLTDILSNSLEPQLVNIQGTINELANGSTHLNRIKLNNELRQRKITL